MTIAIFSRAVRAARLRPLLTVLFFGTMLLSGCDGSAPPAGEPAAVVLKHSKLFGNPAAFDALLARFTAESGVAVKREALPASSDEQHQFYAINLQAGAAEFDVLALDVVWGAEFARAGWLRDLSALVTPQDRADFFAGPLDAATHDGRIYALPWFMDAGLLYYRKDLLEKHGRAPPRTWSELADTAKAVSRAEGGMHGFVWQGKQYEGLVCNALEFVWSAGGDVLSAEGRVVIDAPPAREALAFMRRLVDEGVTPAFVTTLTEEPSREIFGKGDAVFLRNWPYAWRLFQQEGSPVRGRVGMMPLPGFAEGAGSATLGGWLLGVNAHSRRPEAAQRLAAFLASAAAQKEVALAYGYSPPRRSLYANAELLAAQPFLGELKGIMERARPRPVSPRYIALSQVLQAQFSAALSGAEPPEAALASARRQIEDILAR